MSDAGLFNVRPPLSQRGYWAFHWLVTLAGAAVIAVCIPALRLLIEADASLFVVLGLMLLLELGPLFRGRSDDVYGMSSSVMFMFALLLHWGLAAAILGHAAALTLNSLLNRKAPWRAIANIGLCALCLGAAHLALLPFGKGASLAHPAAIDVSTLPALLAAGLAWFAANAVAAGAVAALKAHTAWWPEVIRDIGPLALNDGAAISLAPLVVLAAERSPVLVPLLLIPLFAVYKSHIVSLALQHQAVHDALTGLPNRTHLHERANDVFGAPTRGSVIGLFVVDLDRFKEINDTLGHQAGDRLLSVIAARLGSAVRPGDLVARLGGDEFAVLLPDLADEAAALDVAARITGAVRAPLPLDTVTLNVESSLGIALAPDHGADFDTLLQRADQAMYSAKRRGTSYEIYSEEFQNESAGRLNLLSELRRALEAPTADSDLVLHYQPQVSLRDGRVVGVEALLRWRHPARGLVLPEEFIGKVEQTALMNSLSYRVIDDALQQAARWERAGLGTRVAVNISVTDLHRQDFAAYVGARLRHHMVSPRWLQLELTEGALIVDPGRALATLRSLGRLGVSLSLDDFGTGYSSLSQLHRLPVAEIKIDRSFISRMEGDVDDRTIVRSMIELGRALGLRVVAEGVENEPTWDQLREMGCDDAQGWHISRALPVADVTQWLHLHHQRWPSVAAPTAADIA